MGNVMKRDGYLTWEGAKSGLRFYSVETAEPYWHRFSLTVTPDVDCPDEDAFNEAISSFERGQHCIIFEVDKDGEATCTPSCIAPIDARSGETGTGSIGEADESGNSSEKQEVHHG